MKNKKMLLIPFVLGVICVYWFISKGQMESIMATKVVEKIVVEKWDNIYEGDNIEMYYLNPGNENVLKFGSKNELESLKKEDNLDQKIWNVMDWITSNIEYKKNAVHMENELYEMDFSKEEKVLMTSEEIASVFNHITAYLGIYSRSGYLISDINGDRDKYIYNINEYWNEELDQWVAVDPLGGIGFFKDGKPLSGIELFNLDLQEIACTDSEGNEVEDYKNQLQEFKYAYAVNIDNNVYGKGMINSTITYTKETPFLKVRQAYYTPSIFVRDEQLFNRMPEKNFVNDLEDEIPTMVMGKSNLQEHDENTYLAIGVMKNSRMVKDYYYSVNGSDWLKTDGEFHFFVKVKTGTNRVKISLDGINSDREIIFQCEKDE